MKRVGFLAVLLSFVVVATLWLWHLGAPIDAIVRGASGPPTLVLLHGYGSRADDWLQFEERWHLPPHTQRLFLQAPARGPGRRGWWWLQLERYVDPATQLPDLAAANPGGLALASTLVRERIQGERGPLILGGFSQGAMVAANISFQTDQPLQGLILIGGTPVNEAAWAEHFAGRRHLPIFIAHGRRDPTLSFALMERFQQRLADFGLDVTWYPYDGGHSIPLDVIDQVNAFVGRVLQLESPAGSH